MLYRLGDRIPVIEAEDYFIADSAAVIGSVIIKNNVGIWFNAVLRADHGVITVDENSNVQECCVLHLFPGGSINIGKGVTVTHNVTLHGCTIGDNSLVAINSVVMDNAQVGANCIVGANSLVRENTVIPEGTLFAGSPGKVIRDLTQSEIDIIKGASQFYVDNFRKFKSELVVINP